MAIYNRGRKYNVPGGRAKTFIPTKRKYRKVVHQAVRQAKNKLFEKRVNSVINKNTEVKQKTYVLTKSSTPGGPYYQYIRGGGLEQAGVPGFGIPNILNLLILAPGTGSSERIGLSVNVKELRLKGMIHAQPYNAIVATPQVVPLNTNLSPFDVVMVVYKNKNDKNGAADGLKLDEELNSAVHVDSTPYNDMFPWNRGDYTIKRVKRFRFKGPPVAVAEPQTPTSAPVLANPIYGNASNPLCHRFNLTIPLKNELTWNAPYPGAGDVNKQPQNEWCAVGFYIVNLDGTTCAQTQGRAALYMNATLKYTDA